MTRFSVFQLAAVLALSGCTTPTDRNIAAISAKMSNLAGPGAIECGALTKGRPLDQAWECATSADQSNRPFWLAIESHGTDADIWHVISRSASGKRSIVFYTNNDHDQPTFEPSFTIAPCTEPFQLFKDSRFLLRCGPDIP